MDNRWRNFYIKITHKKSKMKISRLVSLEIVEKSWLFSNGVYVKSSMKSFYLSDKDYNSM